MNTGAQNVSAKSPTLYQNGVIDIFKNFKVFDLDNHNVNQNGEVQSSMDNELGRKIIKITGNLSATNFIEVPNGKFNKSLNFSGKFYYIFIKPFLDKKFSFQLSFIINNESLIKFIFKFPLKTMKFTRSNSYNVDIPFQVENNNWTIFKFDPVDYINQNLMNNYKEFSIFGGLTSENTVLKSIQFWSTIYVRGVYISNGSFGLSNLPKEMGFKVTDQSNSASNINLIQIGLDESDKIKKKLSMEIKEENAEENDLIESNSNLAPSYTNVSQNKSMKNVSKLSNKKNVMENLDSSIKEIQKKNKELKEETKEDVFKNTLKKIEYNTTNNSKLSFNVDKDKERDHNLDLKETNSEMLKRNMDNINKEFADTKKEIIKNILKRDEQKRKPLVPDPIMHLKFILGYTATHSPLVKFYSAYTNDSNNTCEPVMKKSIFFASGNTLIKYDYTDLKQKFYFGHSKPIINYVIACEGQILFSCQEGKNSIIRVWNVNTGRCIKMLTTPYEKITSLSISRDSKILCTVGLESYNKEQILLWDISNLDEIKVYIRQSSHFSVSMIKFSPFEQNILVSCGKENIKFWRIKGDHLGGKAVVLNQYARENNFICLDYDNPLIGDDFNRGRVFIGSNKGCVFQVSCNTQELEAIYKIQDSAILSICVNDAFCATGSLDGYLRVWPIDFKEFIIEAKHDSGVCSVDIGYDAIEIVCGTLNGSIGILDIQTKNYKTLLRTPPSKVQLMVAHPSGDYLFTIEDDRSVRVWDVENKSEAFQFISTKDPPTSIGVPNNSTFACGFTSGVLKIFDLDKTVILYETKSFSSAIMHIKYTQNDKILISMNTQGHMSIHDANNNYIQIKLLKIDEPTINTDISVAIQEDYFATIGPESNCAIVWNSKTYGMKNRIPINNFSITKLALINKNLLCVVLENCTVMFFSLATYEGIIIKEFQSVHIKKVNEFLCTKNYKYLISGGEEGIVKIWDAKMLYKSYTSFQQFIGHSNGVRSIIAIEQKSLIVSVSEDSGIHFWNFMGDLTFCETEITQEFEKFGNAKEMKDLTYKNSNSTRKSANIHNNNNVNTIKASHLEKTYKLEHGHGHSSSNKLRINFDNLNEENTETRNVLSILPVEQEDNLGVDLTHTQSLSNTQSQFFSSEAFKTNNMVNITQQHIKELNDKLLFTPKYIPSKLDKFTPPKNTSEKLNKRLVIGYSTNSIKNIVLNKENQWFAFTVNNKIIVEFLEENRNQIILEDHLDEISCLTMSHDGKVLISASGYANREDLAPICIHDTTQWKLKKKLNFHYKGIQMIKLSSSQKYMISAGNKYEKSICVWNFQNLTVIDSKSLKFPIIDIQPERSTINDNLLYFTTISFDVLSFWRMDSNFRLEGFHLKFEDITDNREEGEIFTALENTPYYDKIKTSFIIIGTNAGAILIIDKEKKILIRKFYISKTPITKILFQKDNFICAGESPIVYCWRYDPERINSEYVFDFLEKEKSRLIFIDSNIVSISFTENEGLIGTDTGSIFFGSFANESAIKILSSHNNCFINSIDYDHNNEFILTSGDDGIVRCWTQDTFDQKFQFMKLDSKCESAMINHSDNVCTVIYDNYMRIYDMNSLRSLGKIKIPDNDINYYGFIFNYQGMIVSTLQDRVFIFDVQNWDPLSLLYTEISNSFMPKNQFFKSIDTKSLNMNKSLVVISFSDGTTSVVSLEKNKGKIETEVIDKFNMFEYHISKSDDMHIAEMYQNLTKFRTNYICYAKFSKKYDDFLFSFHECLQFLYIRNYNKHEVFRRIPLDYFPASISISENEQYIAVGTKEGLILFITRLDGTLQSGFNLDIFLGHYDIVKTLSFNFDNSKLFSSSHSELIVWNIN